MMYLIGNLTRNHISLDNTIIKCDGLTKFDKIEDTQRLNFLVNKNMIVVHYVENPNPISTKKSHKKSNDSTINNIETHKNKLEDSEVIDDA